ncbi:MAG: hypothetical protein AB2A00_06575 [Myxococcota bacterium]
MPAVVTLSYLDLDLGGVTPGDLRVAYVKNGAWTPVTWVGHDDVARTVSGQTMHFSTWGLVERTASASSSGGGQTPSTQLEGICPILASGYMKGAVASYQLTFGGPDCPYFVVTDEQAYESVFGDFTSNLNALCDPEGGLIARWVAQIAASQAAGRLIYDPVAAEGCLQAGLALRSPTDGGLLELIARYDGGVGPLQEAVRNTSGCEEMIIGLVGAGEPCTHSLECAQGATGADCMRSVDSDCQHICVPRSDQGGRCVRDRIGCKAGLTCVGADYNVGTCEAPRGNLASCVVGTNTIPCQEGLFCNYFPGVGPWDKLCHVHYDQGQSCERTQQCRDGLYCESSSSSGGVCAPRPTAGQPCTYDECASCHACVRSGDGGRHCAPRVGDGALCPDGVCRGGLACVGGQCLRRALTGEPCVLDPTDMPSWEAASLRGSCLDQDEACVGTPPTCQPRALAGEACTSRMVATSEQGSCERDHYCLRSAPTDTSGICHPAGLPGRACGTTPDLPAGCQRIGAADPDCVTFDGGSRCLWVFDAPLGSECYDEGLTTNPTCTPGHCMDGFCTLDAGSAIPPGYVGVGEACTQLMTPRCWSSWCDGQTFYNGICRGYVQPGAPCALVTGMFGSYDPCNPSTLCRSAGDGGSVCVERYGENQVCSPGECREDLRCASVDGGVARCVPKLPVGASCSGNDCVAGTQCYAGRCEPLACFAPPSVSADEKVRWWLFITGIVPLALVMGRSRRRRAT